MVKSKRKSKKKSYQSLDISNDSSSQKSTYNRNNNKEAKQSNKKSKAKNGNGNGNGNIVDDYSFRKKLENNGEREIIDMVADGNCLFRSISHQLYTDHGQKHDTVRHEICNYLEKNEDDFKVYLLLEDSSDSDDVCEFDTYVDQMRKDGEWGGDVEIVCASRLYRRAITIFSRVGAYNISLDDDEGTNAPNMLLSYHDNMHYNSVHDSKSKVYRELSENDKNNSSSINEDISKNYEETTNKTGAAMKNNHVGMQTSKQHIPKRNDLCSCGSGLRYKKCCLTREKSKIRLEKYRQKHGINVVQGDDKDSNNIESTNELDGGFAVLNI